MATLLDSTDTESTLLTRLAVGAGCQLEPQLGWWLECLCDLSMGSLCLG